MGHGDFGLLQVVGEQGGCVERICVLSRFISFLRVEGSKAGGAAASGLGQEKGAELEVFATGFADDANDVPGFLVDGHLPVEFILPLANALGNALEGVFESVADLFFKKVPLEAAQALNLFDGFVVPAAEGGAGYVEPGRDGVEGQAFGAEFDESVFGFGIVHRSVES